jgi:hypothetical protein
MFSSTTHLSTRRWIATGAAKADVVGPCSAPNIAVRDRGWVRDRMNPNLLNCSRGLQGTGAGTFLHERPELKTFAPPLRM